jgi:hypothetical protein
MENVFDTLCSALSESSIKSLFLTSEGIDLMVLMMKYVRRSHFVMSLMRYTGKSFNHVRGPSRLWTMPCRALQAARVVTLLSRH